MPVDCLTWPTWRVCRRNPSVLWRNMWGASIPTSPTGSGSSCFACLPSAPSRRPSSSSFSSCGWWGKPPSRLWSGTCCCREAASAGPTCPSSRAAVALPQWQSGVRKYCRVDWNEIATFPLLKTKWRFFFSLVFFLIIPAVVFVIPEPQFSRCRIWIPLMDKLYSRCPETGFFFFVFFAVNPSRGFLGGRGAYLLDPVWIFIMFVNCFVPFMKRFQPSLWENGREVSCLSVVVVVVVAVFLYDFFCTLLPYMALWMTGIFHKDLTCIWSPVVSEGSYFVIISTDKKMRLLIWFFRWIFFNVNIQKMRATNCVENVCTIIIFLHSYFLHILFCTCSLPSSDCVVLQLTQQSNDIFFSRSLNFLAPIFVTKDKILLD